MGAARPPVVYDERALNIFTDGSSLAGPRRGGVGFLIVTVDEQGHEVVDPHQPTGYRSGTSQQMELLAAIEALRYIIGRYSPVDPRDFTKVVIHTDSVYLAENYPTARYTWPTTGWMTRDENPVINADLWKQLLRVASKVGRRVEIIWHKGHSAANPHNKAVDKLAKASATGPLRPQVRHTRVRRKTTDKVTEAGSIQARGQDLVIRIITDDWLRPQRLYMYKCEVVSPDSEYAGNVDTLFSEQQLKAGHTYSVRLNDHPRAPRIEQVHHEVQPPS